MSRTEARNITIYKDAEQAFLDRHPDNRDFYEGALEHSYDILEGVQDFHQLQLKKGFRPPGVTEDRLMAARNDPQNPHAKDMLSAYKFIDEVDGQLIPRDYIEDPDYRKVMEKTTEAVERALDYVTGHPNRPKDANLMEANLVQLDPAFRRGAFHASRVGLMNLGNYPEAMLDAGVSDRYDDHLNQILSGQGWKAVRNDALTARYSKVIVDGQNALANKFTERNGMDFKLFIGDSIAYAGLAKAMGYRGNTMPSEEDIRAESALSYLFENRVNVFVDEVLVPNYGEFIQDSLITRAELKEAAMHMFSGHEGVGHTFVNVGSIELVRSHLTTLKESGSDAIGLAGMLRVVDERLARHIANVLFVRLGCIINQYRKETDPRKKLNQRPYARGAAILMNMFTDHDVFSLDERDKIYVPSLPKLEAACLDFAKMIKDVTHEEEYKPGHTDNVLRYYINKPNPYYDEDEMEPSSFSMAA